MSHAVRRTTFVTAAAVAAIAVAAGTASASTVVTPAGQAVTASSSNLSIKTGTITLTCSSTTGSGTIPAAPGNSTTGTGGINVNIGTPSLTGCKANGLPAVVTTSGSWLLNVSGDAMPAGSAQGSLIIPANGAVVTLPGSTCTVTVVGFGAGGTGVSTIGPLPFDIPNQRVVASNTGTVNYTRTGTGPVCPAAATGTATMSGTLQFASATPIAVTP